MFRLPFAASVLLMLSVAVSGQTDKPAPTDHPNHPSPLKCLLGAPFGANNPRDFPYTVKVVSRQGESFFARRVWRIGTLRAGRSGPEPRCAGVPTAAPVQMFR